MPEYREGEDAGTDAHHRTNLSAEWSKENPSLEIVETYMAATLTRRRYLALVKKKTVKEIQAMYPPLKRGHQV